MFVIRAWRGLAIVPEIATGGVLDAFEFRLRGSFLPQAAAQSAIKSRTANIKYG
jgi:hypothetical protein